jgi:hypothetical protein
MSRPLGLPVGSVRALCLLGLCARAVIDLYERRDVAWWLIAAIVVSAAAYFASRASRPAVTAAGPVPFGTPVRRERDPLGLPRGTIRILFLAAVAVGAWLWFREHRLEETQRPVAVVVGAFFVGVVVRWFLSQVRRPDDSGTLVFEHLQGFTAVVSAAGLVVIAVTRRDAELAAWIQPSLAAVCTYYAGVR